MNPDEGTHSGNRKHLVRIDQVRVRDAVRIGNHLVLAAVTVEALRDGPQRVAGDDGVGPCGGF